MVKSLGLDDDLDPVDAAKAIEVAFDIHIEHAEASCIRTVGEAFELLRSKIDQANGVGKCATAMAYFRLRRALRDNEGIVLSTPADDLSPLTVIYTKGFKRKLEEATGLNLPWPEAGWMTRIGANVVLFAGVGAKVAGWLLPGLLGRFDDWILGGCLAVAVALVQIDPRQLPRSCRTLGDLARSTARLSYGKLIRQGASASDASVWRVLTEVLSILSGVPASDIDAGTYFLESQARHA
jgi:hypothetical protein